MDESNLAEAAERRERRTGRKKEEATNLSERETKSGYISAKKKQASHSSQRQTVYCVLDSCPKNGMLLFRCIYQSNRLLYCMLLHNPGGLANLNVLKVKIL